MSYLKTLGGGARYLKAGFLGFNKSGKTFTAVKLAAGTRKLFKQDGPIAFFDSEGGSDYVRALVQAETGADPVGIKSRAFDDLMGMARECESSGVSVLIVDSITHVWRELCNAYMLRMNQQLDKANKSKKSRMDIQDIMKIKDLWAPWPDFYLNSRLHIIICGRAGFEWAMEENEETGKKELMKVGVKMKVESEFGFEPSLLVEMERVQNHDSGKPMTHRATVLGDRFGVIDAKTCEDPGFAFFEPHVRLLLAGEHTEIDTTVKSEPVVDEGGNDAWQREKRERVILCEEIQAELVRRWPSQSADDKKAKADTLDALLKTRSWTKVESLDSAKLRKGLSDLRAMPETVGVA